MKRTVMFFRKKARRKGVLGLDFVASELFCPKSCSIKMKQYWVDDFSERVIERRKAVFTKARIYSL